MSKFWSEEEEDSSIDEESENKQSAATSSKNQQSPIAMVEGTDPNAAWAAIKDSQQFHGVPCKVGTCSLYSTRLVCMSDTHGLHQKVCLPKGDVLIHGGDLTKTGEIGTLQDLSRYFQHAGFKHVVCIAGNHDVTLHPQYYERAWDRYHRAPLSCDEARKALSRCIYLEDTHCNTIPNLTIYGSPWSPEFFDWAFNAERDEISAHWNKIPSSTDILITHGPPLGRGDLTREGNRAGCYDLLCQVQERIKPRVHTFGHVHEGYGTTYDGQTLCVNASNLNVQYQPNNLPIVVDVPHDLSKSAEVVKPDCKILTANEFMSWLDGKEKYAALADNAQESSALQEEFPGGNAIFTETAYKKLCFDLLLHRDLVASKSLRHAIAEIYAESFATS